MKMANTMKHYRFIEAMGPIHKHNPRTLEMGIKNL
jgi:hypothetical protein